MPEVLVTKDDKAVTILSSRDFEEQIEKYIGSDFAKHYHRQIEELSYHRTTNPYQSKPPTAS